MAKYAEKIELNYPCGMCQQTFSEYEGSVYACCGYGRGRCNFIRYECPRCGYRGTRHEPEYFEKYPNYEVFHEARFG